MIAHQLLRRVSQATLLMAALASLTLYGCPGGGSSGSGGGSGSGVGGQPVITLKVTDCPKDQIKINPKITKSRGSTSCHMFN
ncbi:MAG TPA: hypothetical protein VIX59_05280 [Candidatus Binataceae bacterium]